MTKDVETLKKLSISPIRCERILSNLTKMPTWAGRELLWLDRLCCYIRKGGVSSKKAIIKCLTQTLGYPGDVRGQCSVPPERDISLQPTDRLTASKWMCKSTAKMILKYTVPFAACARTELCAFLLLPHACRWQSFCALNFLISWPAQVWASLPVDQAILLGRLTHHHSCNQI